MNTLRRLRLASLLTTLTLGVALVAACGGDDTNGGSSSGVVPDAGGSDVQTTDTGTNPGADAGKDTGVADGGCTFAGYVIGLINSSTTSSAIPATDLGDNCTPSTDQADFKTLFP